MQRIVRLKLTGRPTAGWTDAFATDPAECPYIVQGAAALLEFAIFNPGGTALVSTAGLSAITLEVYRGRTGDAISTAIIAPATVSIETAGLTLSDWNANASPGTAAGRHFKVELTGEQTNVSFLSTEDAILEAWMEVYATYAGDRISLGAGPLKIHRSAAGATPADPVSQYYTQAQVDALLATRPAISVSGGVASFSLGGTDYAFPVGTAS